MKRVQRTATAVAMALAATVAWPTLGSAIEVNSTLSTSSVLLGSTTAINGEVFVRHPGPGFANDIVVTGSLPNGFVLNNVQMFAAYVGGEEIWNNDAAAIMVYDGRDGSELERLPITVAGVPQADGCGVFGMDAHPVTGEYYAMIGLMPDNSACDTTTRRDLFRVDPFTGQATWLGTPPVTFNGLSFTANGDLYGITGNASVRRGSLWKIDLDGNGAFFAPSPIPGAEVTWNDPSMVGPNHDDGLFYHFYLCQMATTDISSKAKSSIVNVDTGNCPDNGYTVVSYIGNNQFIVVDWNDVYIFDVTTNEWTYQTGLNDSIHGGLAAGRELTAFADCQFTATTYTCTIPRVVALGQYVIEFDGDFTPVEAGTATFDVSAGGVSASKDVTVVGTDLKAFASANVQRVDTTNTVKWTLEAENVGSSAAANTTLSIIIPNNQTYVGASFLTGGCNLAGQTLTCNLGSIQAGNLGRVVLTTTANANGISDIVVNISTSSAELSAANNSATARVVVGPAADLAVSITRPASKDGTAPTDMPGKPMPITFVVANLGPNDAVDATVYHTLPAKFDLTTADPDQGTCAVASRVLKCNLGTIAVNKTVKVNLSPTAVSAGTYAVTATAESLVTPDMDLANNTATLNINVLPPTLQVAAGKSARSVSGAKAALAQLVLTHGGQTEQALAVKSLTFEGAFARLRLQTVRVLIIDDIDGDGRADADERVIGTGDVTVDGEAAGVRLSRDGIELKKGESKTVLIVLRDSVSTQVASLGDGTSMAMLGLLPLALLFGLRRRNGLPLVVLALVMLGATACSDEETEAVAKVQLTLTAVEVELAEGPSPAAPVEGLPLTLPTVEVK